MSKAQRVRAQNARERIAAQQAAARRTEMRRRAMMAGGAVVVVIAVVVAIIVYVGNKNSPPASASNNGVSGTVLPSKVANDITGVSATTLDAVGKGSVPSYAGGSPVTPISNTPLTSGGKPEMLYIGAEFCPYCAAMRWSMAVALSRFGHFTTPFRGFHSSPTDTDPNTPTLTFYKAGYTSKYLTFTPVENETINRTPLQNTTSSQMALWEKYDSSSEGVGYPFIDFGNKAVIKNPLYDPGVLKGKSWAQVAAALHDSTSPIAQGADGTANYITAAICKMTNNKPSNVCTSSTISSLEASI